MRVGNNVKVGHLAEIGGASTIGEHAKVFAHHREFKWAAIAPCPTPGGVLSGNRIRQWVQDRGGTLYEPDDRAKPAAPGC